MMASPFRRWGALLQCHRFLALATLLSAIPWSVAAEGTWRGESHGDFSRPEGVLEVVREEVARRWDVDPSSVVLEWIGPPSFPDIPAGVQVMAPATGEGWLVGVKGEEGVSWGRIRVGLRVPRWVAARSLPRGHVLEEGELRLEDTVRWGSPPTVAMPAPKPGWLTRRTLREGEELRPPWVVPPDLVTAGSPVMAEVHAGRVLLRLVAEARSSGALGDRVRVRLPSGRIVMGEVQEGPVVVIAHPVGQGGADDS